MLGTRYNRDTRLQTPGTAPLVTQMCHNLAPARAQRGQRPGGQLGCKKLICVMNLGAGLKHDSRHLGTNIVSDLERKIELKTNLRKV